MTDCALCTREPKTKVYFDNDGIWIADDVNKDGHKVRICAAFKQHGVDFTEQQISGLIKKLMQVCLNAYPNARFNIEKTMRTCPDHFHLHATSENEEYIRHPKEIRTRDSSIKAPGKAQVIDDKKAG